MDVLTAKETTISKSKGAERKIELALGISTKEQN